ncbi:hypothetical protein ACFXO8_36795, partial [Nocardia tengchongensis]
MRPQRENPYWDAIVGDNWPGIGPDAWSALEVAARAGAAAMDVGGFGQARRDFDARVRASASLQPVQDILRIEQGRLWALREALDLVADTFADIAGLVRWTGHRILDITEDAAARIHAVQNPDPQAPSESDREQQISGIVREARDEVAEVMDRTLNTVGSQIFPELLKISGLLGQSGPDVVVGDPGGRSRWRPGREDGPRGPVHGPPPVVSEPGPGGPGRDPVPPRSFPVFAATGGSSPDGIGVSGSPVAAAPAGEGRDPRHPLRRSSSPALVAPASDVGDAPLRAVLPPIAAPVYERDSPPFSPNSVSPPPDTAGTAESGRIGSPPSGNAPVDSVGGPAHGTVTDSPRTLGARPNSAQTPGAQANSGEALAGIPTGGRDPDTAPGGGGGRPAGRGGAHTPPGGVVGGAPR